MLECTLSRLQREVCLADLLTQEFCILSQNNQYQAPHAKIEMVGRQQLKFNKPKAWQFGSLLFRLTWH